MGVLFEGIYPDELVCLHTDSEPRVLGAIHHLYHLFKHESVCVLGWNGMIRAELSGNNLNYIVGRGEVKTCSQNNLCSANYRPMMIIGASNNSLICDCNAVALFNELVNQKQWDALKGNTISGTCSNDQGNMFRGVAKSGGRRQGRRGRTNFNC